MEVLPMSALSISSLYPFRRAKIINCGQIIEPELGRVIHTELNPDLRFTPICSDCGSKAEGIHSWHHRSVKDLKLAEADNLITLNYRKIYCPTCGIKIEQLNVTDPGGPHVTNRMARYIFELCKLMTIQEVANHLNLDWKTVKKIDQQFLEKELGETDYSNSGLLAIDEISFGKYHKYLTVVLDFQTGRVIWVGEKRKVKTLDKFFENMPENDRINIKAITMDMWDPYIKAVRKWCPDAVIVFDKFHIVSSFSKVIDQVRRSETKKAISEQEQTVLKGSRWLLLKNKKNLKDKEKPKLDKLLKINENLSKVYILKDELKLIWKTDNFLDMRESLNNWYDVALESKLAPVTRFVAKLKRYQYGILTHVFYPIHTSKLEGTNNKIKEIKRSAYGFHDNRYFALKIKQAFPGKT